MSNIQLLSPIFLTSRQPTPLIMIVLLTNLLKKGIQWKHFQVYTPSYQEQISRNYIPTQRWDWENYSQNRQFLQIRYLWAVQTLTKLQIYGEHNYEFINQNNRQDHIYDQKVILPNNMKQINLLALGKNNQMNCLSALAFIRIHYLSQDSHSYLGWNQGFLKLVQSWLKLADHLNLLFTQNQLQSYTKSYSPKRMIFPGVPENLKRLIKNEYKKSPNLFKDFSLPYFRWNEGKADASGKIIYNFPTNFSKYFSEFNYDLLFADPNNKRSNLDSGFRYYLYRTDKFHQSYNNTNITQKQLINMFDSFIHERNNIMNHTAKIKYQTDLKIYNQRVNWAVGQLDLLHKNVFLNKQNTNQIYQTINHYIIRANKLIDKSFSYPFFSWSQKAFDSMSWLYEANNQRLRQIIMKRLDEQNLMLATRKQLKNRYNVSIQLVGYPVISHAQRPNFPFLNGSLSNKNYIGRFRTGESALDYKIGRQYHTQALKYNWS